MKKRIIFLLAIMLFVLPCITLKAQAEKEIKSIEDKFDKGLSAENIKSMMKHLSAHPHHVGSPWDKNNAEFIASQFKSWGFDTNIEVFYVLFPSPKLRKLEMIFPKKFTATLNEPALKEDSTSDQQDEQLPTYNAYSADGDVTAELVYVNYGVPKDYEILEENGIDVKGKIVIARYGGSWRGIKPKIAAEHGAIGCIIYSDPHEDGYYEGDVYPKGAYRNDEGVQRGSVADMPVYSGDPLTPFIGATKDAKRLQLKEATTLMKIPVLPISYGDALPLLRSLEGPVVPDSWKGALPITYHMGPGKTKVHLKLEFNWDIKPVYDVIAKINGSEFPDEWVIRGNHHDGWVNGAEDPLSGQVALLEEAKSIGQLVKEGWKPKRTLVYCAWDGEEPGLLGSTEWVETHADELKQKAVAYINSDGNGRGFLYAGASHSLQHFINEIAREINDPERNISVYERRRDQLLLKGSPEEKKEAREHKDFRVRALGSGSDYTPFLQHIGIPSMNVGFGGEDEGGVYHSIYDSYDHYIRFGDPTFEYGVALAEFGGHAMIELADADILPFRFSDFVAVIEQYIYEISKLTDDMREKTVERNNFLQDSIYTIVSDPTKKYIPPKPEDAVPFINFAPLQNAAVKLRKSADDFSSALASFTKSGKSLSSEKEKTLNIILKNAEQYLVSKSGLPGRPWYAHQIYAPGLYTGYGVKTLPGVREAIEQRDWKIADSQIEVTSNVIEDYAAEIDKATNILSSE